MLSVESFLYETSGAPYIKQGVRNNRVPKDAVAGGNGTFVMKGTPPKAFFYFKQNDSGPMRKDFYPIIRGNSTRRVTEKYCVEIFDRVSKRDYDSLRDLQEAIIAECV